MWVSAQHPEWYLAPYMLDYNQMRLSPDCVSVLVWIWSFLRRLCAHMYWKTTMQHKYGPWDIAFS